jgi:hypothetical protein
MRSVRPSKSEGLAQLRWQPQSIRVATAGLFICWIATSILKDVEDLEGIERDEERAETEGIENEVAWSASIVPEGSMKFTRGVKED